MNKQATAFQMTRSEQETQNEANRLTVQIETALAAVVMRSPTMQTRWNPRPIELNEPLATSPPRFEGWRKNAKPPRISRKRAVFLA